MSPVRDATVPNGSIGSSGAPCPAPRIAERTVAVASHAGSVGCWSQGRRTECWGPSFLITCLAVNSGCRLHRTCHRVVFRAHHVVNIPEVSVTGLHRAASDERRIDVTSSVCGTRAQSPARVFYLDLNDTIRRAALLTAVVRDKVPTAASLKREYAQTLAQLCRAPLNTARQPRIDTGGPVLRLARARGLVDGSVLSSSYRADSRAVAIRHVQHGLMFLGLQHPPLRALCDLLITDILC